MPRDEDGNIFPSHVRLESTPDRPEEPHFMRNNVLRYGEVQEAVYPDDTRSLSGQFVEYRVYVQERWGAHAGGRVYTNCVLLNSLAGLADRETYALRGDPNAAKSPGGGPGKGSKVVLLCINGEERAAVIIGGVRDPKDDSEEKSKAKDRGQFYEWRFNGLSFAVDDDGALKVAFGGKTQIDGTLDPNVDKSTLGSRVEIAKDGSVSMVDVDGNGADQQRVAVDHANQNVLIDAKKALKITHSEGVQIGRATDKMLMGSTYRKAQQTLDNSLSVNFQSLQVALQTAGAALTTAGAAMVTPVTGAQAAAPSVTLAAQFVTLAATYAGQLQKAVQAFEQQGGQFLSKKSALD